MKKNMSKKKLYSLNKNDKIAAQMLTNLGMQNKIAKTLLYLSHVNECPRIEIEKGVHISQPEVSAATKVLLRKNWIKKRILKQEGKGRPRYSYSITRNLSDIMKDFEHEKLKEINDIKNDISKLKKLFAG